MFIFTHFCLSYTTLVKIYSKNFNEDNHMIMFMQVIKLNFVQICLQNFLIKQDNF